MKDYSKVIAVFLLIFFSINLEINKIIPPVMGYVFCALYVIFGYIAYQKHNLLYIKRMYIISIAIQLLFFMAFPYWIIKSGTALNISSLRYYGHPVKCSFGMQLFPLFLYL